MLFGGAGYEARRWALSRVVPGLGLLAVFLLLGREARDGHVLRWDRSIWSFLHGHEEAAHGSLLDRSANLIAEGGGRNGMLVLGLVLIGVLFARGRTRDALFVLSTGVATLVLTPLLKEAFERGDLKYSFPSGHSAAAAALATAAVTLAWPTRFRWPSLVLGVLFSVTLGAVLVWEDWHLPSDVLGGWCLGIVCAGTARAAFAPPARTPRPR
jgi:membrane-associated phospholipid phosphatase